MPIRPTFYGFEMARTALSASQKNIDVTGQNIANINTPGYSRQRVNLSSVGPGGINWRYALHPSELVGLGVNVDSIRRVRDQFLDARFRNEMSANARIGVKNDILTYVENNVDEFVHPEGTMQNILSQFHNAFQDLHMYADEVEFMKMTSSAARMLVTTTRSISTNISQIWEHSYEQLSFVKDEVNRIAQALEDVNNEIRTHFLLNAVPNELLDKRDLLLDQLSGFGEVTVRPAPIDYGNGPIDTFGLHIYFGKLEGDWSEDDHGDWEEYLLVSGNTEWHNTLEISDKPDNYLDPDNPVRLSWVDGSGGDFHTVSGEIFGYYEMLNGIGNIEEDGDTVDLASKGIPYFMNMMNTFVSTLADVFNELNDDDDLFIYDMDNPAATITINPAWLDDPSYILRTLDNSDTPGAARNDNILRMIDALKKEREFIEPNSGNTYTGSFFQYINTINTELGLEIDYLNKSKDVSDINLLSIDMYRASIMDVDSDEEAMNLVKYQKSYNAAARFMTTLDEMLDVIINRLGIVGR